MSSKHTRARVCVHMTMGLIESISKSKLDESEKFGGSYSSSLLGFMIQFQSSGNPHFAIRQNGWYLGEGQGAGNIWDLWIVIPPWLVVSTPLKNISQIGSSSQLLGKIKNVPNHQPAPYFCGTCPIISTRHIPSPPQVFRDDLRRGVGHMKASTAMASLSRKKLARWSCSWPQIPSGKRLHNYGKIHHF